MLSFKKLRIAQNKKRVRRLKREHFSFKDKLVLPSGKPSSDWKQAQRAAEARCLRLVGGKDQFIFEREVVGSTGFEPATSTL
jgi:hypothetical protein